MHYELCIMNYALCIGWASHFVQCFRHLPAPALEQRFHRRLSLRAYTRTVFIILLVPARGAALLDADAVAVPFVGRFKSLSLFLHSVIFIFRFNILFKTTSILTHRGREKK